MANPETNPVAPPEEQNWHIDNDTEIVAGLDYPVGDLAAADRGLAGVVPHLYRYGPAALVGLATENPYAAAAAAAGGEAAYQYWMDYINGEDLTVSLDNAQRHLENLYEAGTQAAWSFMGSAMAPLAQRLVRETGRIGWSPVRAVVARKPIEDTVLSAEAALERASLGDEVYTLSLSQRYGDELGWAQTLESWGRSAFIGRGRFKALDKANRAALLRLAESHIQQRARVLPVETFADEVARAIQGQTKFTDELTNWFYTQFRNAADDAGVKFNVRELFDWFIDNGVTGKVGEGYDEAQTVFKEVKDILRVKGLADSKGLVDNPERWANLDADTWLKVRHRINDLIYEYKATKSEKRIYEQAAKLVRKAGKSFDDNTNGWLEAADHYIGTVADRVNKDVIKSWLRQMAKDPERGIELLRKTVNRNALVDQLKDYFSELTMRLPTGQVMKGTSLGGDAFEHTILKPLRHSIIAEAQHDGKIVGMALKNTLNRLGDSFLTKVFGSAELQRWKDLASALEIIEGTRYGDKVFIQLVQGGALTHFGLSAARGGASMVARTAPGVMSVTMIPYALSRLMSNPTRLNIVMRGLISGPKTKPFVRAIAQITALNKEVQKELINMPMEYLGYYNTLDGKGIISGRPPEQPTEYPAGP